MGAGSASAGAPRPARPNARRPSQPVFRDDDSDDENATTELNPFPPLPTAQPTARPSVTTVTPRTSPQGPSVVFRPRIPLTSPGVFRGPDREPPPANVPSGPTPFTPKTPFQRPTEPPEPSILPAEGECGRMGQGTTKSAPWVVSLGVLEQKEFRVTCWGALVSVLHVIAAAHCLQDANPSHVRLGDPQQTVDVPLDTWVTDGYNSQTRENDLALITMARPVTFNDNVRPVCLPFRYRFDGLRGQLLSVVGWGDGGALESRKVEVRGTQECSASYKPRNLLANNNVAPFSDRSLSPSPSTAFISPRSSAVTVDRRNLCGAPASSASARFCLSDFGAPIFFHDEDTTGLHFLAGVSTLDNTCQEGPGLYTRLGAFIPWLSQQLNQVAPPAPNIVPGSASSTGLELAGSRRG